LRKVRGRGLACASTEAQMRLNKTRLVRAIARRSRGTGSPLTVEQTASMLALFLAVVCEEVSQPHGRVEIEGFIVIEQVGVSGRARLSPALKQRIERAVRASEGPDEPA
jgi:hypothetical protein